LPVLYEVLATVGAGVDVTTGVVEPMGVTIGSTDPTGVTLLTGATSPFDPAGLLTGACGILALFGFVLFGEEITSSLCKHPLNKNTADAANNIFLTGTIIVAP